MPQVSEMIKEIKVRYGLTQPDLARHFGVTQTTISNYANGKVERQDMRIVRGLEDILAGNVKVGTKARRVEKALFNDLIMGAEEIIQDDWLTGDMVPKLQGLIARARRLQHGPATRRAMGSPASAPAQKNYDSKKDSKGRNKSQKEDPE